MLQHASMAFKSLNLFLSVITLENSSVFPKRALKEDIQNPQL